jgi:RNA polymerase sigma factor for flagellar operon FliA
MVGWRIADRDLEGAVPDDTTAFPDGPGRNPDPDGLDRLWEDYRATGAPEARERLILHYVPLVKYVAARVAARAPAFVQRSDLASAGVFGLIASIDRYDPGRGIRFETYAISRIRGAILDELRVQDRLPRSVRTMARRIDGARAELAATLKRSPSDHEVAALLEVDVTVVREALRSLRASAVIDLDRVIHPDAGDGEPLLERVTGVTGGPLQDPAHQDRRTRLVDAINALEERERLVLTLYYFGALTLADIAEVIGLSEARVWQVRARAVERLRDEWLATDDADSEPAPPGGAGPLSRAATSGTR